MSTVRKALRPYRAAVARDEIEARRAWAIETVVTEFAELLRLYENLLAQMEWSVEQYQRDVAYASHRAPDEQGRPYLPPNLAGTKGFTHEDMMQVLVRDTARYQYLPLLAPAVIEKLYRVGRALSDAMRAAESVPSGDATPSALESVTDAIQTIRNELEHARAGLRAWLGLT
jgi:hypothetical protein